MMQRSSAQTPVNLRRCQKNTANPSQQTIRIRRAPIPARGQARMVGLQTIQTPATAEEQTTLENVLSHVSFLRRHQAQSGSIMLKTEKPTSVPPLPKPDTSGGKGG